jgi:2-methylcitrate dehydratase
MSQTVVQRIARWALEYDVTDIPRGVVTLMKHSVLDSIGCAILTTREDCVRGVLAYAASVGGAPQATVIGGAKIPLGLATLVNGVLVRAIDYNDHLALDPNDSSKLGGHPSDNLAAVLAVAEWRNLSGAAVLAALLASYELYGRVYKFLTPDLPWDHSTAFGFSVPAAAARLLDLDSVKTAHAIAISVAQSATLGAVRRGQLSHSKFLASALVGERGVEAALLAAAGVTGPMTVFEDSRGVGPGLFRRHDGMDSLFASPQPRHMIEGVTIKAFPGMDTSQAAVETAIKAARGRSIRAEEVSSIELDLNDHPMTRQQASDPNRRAPNSRETADHSFYYMIAVALLDGQLTPRQFEEDRWFDAEVLDLMRKITIRADPDWANKAPGGFPCRLRLTRSSGEETVVEVPYAIGHAHNKMNQAQVVEKFRGNVDGIIDNTRAEDIICAIDELERLSSIRELTKLFAYNNKAQEGSPK